MYRLLAVLSIAIISSGCASIGEKEYGCEGIPVGVTCMSSRDIFDNSNAGETPTRIVKNDVDNSSSSNLENEHDLDYTYHADKPSKKISQVKTIRRITDPVLDTFVTPNIPDRPIPVRTPAQVMRIWVSTWEDQKSGALMAPGYVYTEIEPRRWVIGKPESAAKQQGRTFNPLGSPNKSR